MTGKYKKTWHDDSDQFYVGIDVGSVSLNCIVINCQRQIVHESPYCRHLGKVEEEVFELVQEIYRKFGKERILSVSFTGNHGRKLSEDLNAFYEFDTISQVLGAVFVKPDVRTVISMGGQDTALFQIGHSESGWQLEYFNTNGPCASGTGSFIDQQAQRLATSIYSKEFHVSQHQTDEILTDFIRLGMDSKRPANVACRCTVFTKSDMIHLQNKGERLEDIIYGLHVGNARNYMSTIVSNRRLEGPLLFIGGLSLNALQIKALKEYFPGLIVPPYNTSIGALGVALRALDLDRGSVADSGHKISSLDLERCKAVGYSNRISVPIAQKLELKYTDFPGPKTRDIRVIQKYTKVYLGIDIGSTTTKYVLMDEARKIVHKRYVPTQGKPIEVTQSLLKYLMDDVGKKIDVVGIATTGSGRNVVGDFLNADLIIDEITAHARGAVEIDPEVDTIFEIGGQDSKYIYISNSYPLDFDMNKICAAGTGSFLHELANKYGINIVGEFQEIALSSNTPVRLAERCTVFMESDLVSYHQKGIDKKDLIAGLCYAIVHNYLNRVVGKRKVGRRVMFLGGPSLNKGVVAAFENILGCGIIVPEHREVLGAYGAAISVQEKMHQKNMDHGSFRELVSVINDKMEHREKICHADPNCFNQCKLKIYDFDGRRSIWGGECGRYELAKSRGVKKENFFDLRQKVWQAYMTDVYEELKDDPVFEVDGRPTIGMQRALYTHQNAILWAHFFDQLGFRVVLTPPTNTHISKAGIETVVAETCYPVKVSHGHVKELIGKTRYVFLPSLINMPTPHVSEVGFYCPMLQGNSYMLRAAFGMDSSNILTPTIHLKYDPDSLAIEISKQIRSKLGVNSTQIRKALYYALDKQEQFIEELYREGHKIIDVHDSHEPLVIVTGRPYNLYDERLNLRLGQNLAKIGISALPMDFIDVSSVDLSDFPSMYWGLGARILRTARFVKGHANYFGLHLTNFSCGADSFIEHFYKHIMGSKAYLILELDEHSAVAGVMTRLEAYKNVIDNTIQTLTVGLERGGSLKHYG